MISAARHRKQPEARFQTKQFLALLKAQPATARVFAYVRVSTEDQNVDMQLAAVRAAGVTDENIFLEKISAVNAKRPQFGLLLKMLEPGDTLLVYSLSRLSRDLKQLLALVDYFSENDITLRSTSEAHIDPSTAQGRLLISITGAVDENERLRIRDRTRDGMAELKRQGMYLGRPRLVTPEMAKKMQTLRNAGVAPKEIARMTKVKVSTVYANTKPKKKAA